MSHEENKTKNIEDFLGNIKILEQKDPNKLLMVISQNFIGLVFVKIAKFKSEICKEIIFLIINGAEIIFFHTLTHQHREVLSMSPKLTGT